MPPKFGGIANTREMAPKNFRGIANLRKHAPKIWGHSKYTKIRPRKNFGGIVDSGKYAHEIRGMKSGGIASVL